MPRDPFHDPPAYTPDAVDLARQLALDGASRREIAAALGIDLATLRKWRLTHPDFAAALDEWRGEADDDVERALWVEARSGNVAAARFWLTNRRADRWRNRTDVAQTGDVEVTIVTGVPRDREGGDE